MQTDPWLKPGALGLFFGAFLLVELASCAGAGERSQRYLFDVLDQPVPVGAHTELTVKLIDASTGQPVQGATIAGSSLKMTHLRRSAKGPSPGRMMTAVSGDVSFMGSPGPGLYQLMADVSMPGKWKLDLSANVPGETEPVIDTVKFEAGY